jgi:hypothetical protein
MAEGEKSLDKLIQLVISIYYNRDITNREKNKRHDLIAAPTQLGPTSWVCYHGGQEAHFYRECLRGNSPGDSPSPNQDPILSAKVTTGGLSAPVSRWKTRCYLLWIDRSQPPVHAPFLGIDVEKPHGSHYHTHTHKTKDHFLARQWSSFLCLIFLSGSLVQWQKLSFRANLASP